ncbi:unnamed protein product [Plutella xylostella]|uniref:(diamondback moth) hypothetical protein n=1 Tax=Plutella xylostella TaxID=51655 RepID=A0A8S4DVZ2_PLUXY|nr:unnamed protein product [Plutella xylostella]
MKDPVETEENVPPKDTKVAPSILGAFDLLREPKNDTKIIGGAKIISILQGNENEKNVQYALKRCVRSLGANHPDMRSGYFATLVTLLSKFEDITVTKLTELLKKELHANGSSKSEVGDVALGQILVCGAIFRSGLMLRSSVEEQTQVIKLLLVASNKKSYLSTVAYLILLDFVKKLDEDQFSTIIWSNIKENFKKDLKEHSLDSLYFLMVVSTQFPQKVKLRKLIGVGEILCEDTVHTICEKLMSGIDYSSVSHPVFKEVSTLIANSPHLQLFWTSGIDSQLMKHNRNRELVALNILSTILTNITDNFEVIPELLSKNFFKLFMDWFKGLQTASKIRNKRDNEDDHKIMIKKQKEVLNALAKALKSEKVDMSVRIETLKKLLFTRGEMNFTEITGTNIVKAIMSDLDLDGVKKMAKLFKKVLLNTSKKVVKDDVERNWYNNERLKAAEMISLLVSHDAVKDDTEFKLAYMKILMCFGFFKISGDETVAVSSELSGSIKSCFYRCFTSKFSNVDSLVQVLCSLSEFINTTIQNDQVKSKIEKQFSKENMECWEMVTEITQTIEGIDSKGKVDKVFLILLYQLGLFLYSEPTHIKMAKGAIKELKSCYEHYKKGKKKKPKKAKDVEEVEEEPEWIEVLVEVLLSILSAESSVLRAVVQCVFRLLWEFLTPSCIEQIVSVLDPESETNPLTQDSDSEDEDGDKDKDEPEENGEEESGEEKSDAESDESDSEIEVEDEDQDATIPDQLRIAVQKALGAAAESDNESIDADMITEEEGKKLDDALAEAFKQFHQGKNKKTKKDRKDKKTLSDFRIKVLDLIDIYLEKDPAMDIALSMMAPLTRSLEFCIQESQPELGNRLRKTIKNLAKIRKFSSIENVTIDILCEYLKSAIDKGTRSHFMYQSLGDVITHYATFIIHCSLKIQPAAPKSPKKSKKASSSPLTEIFKENLQSYFKNRNCLLPVIFFHSVLQAEWEGALDLLPVIVENIFSAEVRQFRRSEGLELAAGFYRALKRTKPTSKKALASLAAIETNFEEVLKKTLSGENEEFTAKNNFFNTLKKLINTMKMFHESCHVESSVDFNSLLAVVGSCKGTVKTKDSNNQTQAAQNGNADKKTKKKNKKKKRKQEESNGHVEPKQKKSRKDSNSEASE